MTFMRFNFLTLCAAMIVPTVTCSQNYPTRPVRIVSSEAGASNDFLSRVVAQGLSPSLGQQVIVDNRASAVMPGIVARAAPDGYTLLIATNLVWVAPFLQTVSYNVTRELTPITVASSSPCVFVVNNNVPATSIKELIELAKAKPGQLNYGSGGTGGSNQLATELFKSMAGVNIVGVPYKGSGAAITGVVSGEIQVMAATASSIAMQVKSNRVKALAVTSARPSSLFPGLPTVASAGVPGYEFATANVMFAPIATPVALINRLNQEVVAVLKKPDTKEKLFNAGMDVIASSPAQASEMVKADMARMGKLIKDANIHTD